MVRRLVPVAATAAAIRCPRINCTDKYIVVAIGFQDHPAEFVAFSF